MSGLDRLRSEVAEQKTVIASAKSLLASIAQKLRDSAATENAANALADEIDAETNALAQAVAENTPSGGDGGGTGPGTGSGDEV